MRVSAFLAGSLAAVAATTAAAVVLGMPWYGVVGMDLAVWVVAQLLYVGLVALRAREVGAEQTEGAPRPTRQKTAGTRTIADRDSV